MMLTPGTAVAVKGFGLDRTPMTVAEKVATPRSLTGEYYALDFANGNRAPGFFHFGLLSAA